MKYWKTIILLVLVATSLAHSSEKPADIPETGFQLSPEPIREAFQARLLANEQSEPNPNMSTVDGGTADRDRQHGVGGPTGCRSIGSSGASRPNTAGGRSGPLHFPGTALAQSRCPGLPFDDWR